MFTFIPWRKIRVEADQRIVRRFLRSAADMAEAAFKAGMDGPHTGWLYRRRRGAHRASAPGEYPAKDSGALRRSIRSRVNADSATIGTSTGYAKYLRTGTRRMRRRRMSDDALTEGVKRSRASLRGWIRWTRI